MNKVLTALSKGMPNLSVLLSFIVDTLCLTLLLDASDSSNPRSFMALVCLTGLSSSSSSAAGRGGSACVGAAGEGEAGFLSSPLNKVDWRLRMVLPIPKEKKKLKGVGCGPQKNEAKKNAPREIVSILVCSRFFTHFFFSSSLAQTIWFAFAFEFRFGFQTLCVGYRELTNIPLLLSDQNQLECHLLD